jgi:hypothetical protein
MIPFSNFKKNLTINRNIIVGFSGTPTYFNVTKSIVRFDKDFAFSYSMDDGLGDSVLTALPAFKGGNVVEKDGLHLNYPGLFYSDGCGNEHPFNFELKINGDNISNASASAYYMNYVDFRKAYVNGAHYVNHSFSHKDGDEDFSLDPATKEIEIIAEISNNYDIVKSSTGIRMNNFNSPSNYMPYYPIAYNLYLTGTAGVKRVGGMRPWLSTTERFNGHTIDDPMETYLDFPEIGTGTARDYNTWKHSTITHTDSDFDLIEQTISGTTPTNHYWFTTGSHAVGLYFGAADGDPGAGFKWSSFSSFFERLETKYGAIGADNMLMDNENNVWEYLRCYKNLLVSIQDLSNTEKNIKLDFSKCNPEYRYHSSSFVISTDANITGITFTGYNTTSYKINYKSLGNGNVLVNVQYLPQYEKALFNRLNALVSVETLERIQLEEDKIIAQNNVNLLLKGSYRDSLQSRIDAVIILPDSITIKMDFGTTLSNYDTPIPWNNWRYPVNTVVTSGTTYGTLLSMASTVTPLTLTVSSGSFTVVANGVLTTGGTYPVTAQRDSFSAPLGTFGTLTLGGLSTDKKYDIKILGCRNISSLQKYTVNGVVQTYNIQNNISHTVDFLNITGVTEIPIRVEGNTSAISGILSVLEIIEHV